LTRSALFLRTLGPQPFFYLAPRLVGRLDPEATETILEGLRCLFRLEAKDDVLGLAAPHAVLPRRLIHGPIGSVQLTLQDEAPALALSVHQHGDMEDIEPVER
jgi:hypothetical protein